MKYSTKLSGNTNMKMLILFFILSNIVINALKIQKPQFISENGEFIRSSRTRYFYKAAINVAVHSFYNSNWEEDSYFRRIINIPYDLSILKIYFKLNSITCYTYAYCGLSVFFDGMYMDSNNKFSYSFSNRGWVYYTSGDFHGIFKNVKKGKHIFSLQVKSDYYYVYPKSSGNEDTIILKGNKAPGECLNKK